jgi:cytoskeleton protein RodZ
MDETAAPASAPKPRSIGERLRAGRERAGLSVPAAAEKLHLDPKVIEALEADRFAELGASVYVRGHLRRYADFVGEPGIELVNAYVAREARPPPPDLTQFPQAERRADPRRLLTPMVGVGCAVILASAIWWVLAGSTGDPSPSSPPSTEAPAPAPAPPANESPPPTVEPPSQLASKPMSTVPPDQTNVSGAIDPAANAAAEAARREEVASARRTTLRLELTGESWVEVYDSRGQRLYYDVASAGSVQSIEGRPPLRVVLGNAAAVGVQVDGRARDIPAGAIEGDGASFVVNRSGTLSRSR